MGVKDRISLEDHSKPAQKISASNVDYQTINFTDEYIYFADENELRKVKYDGTEYKTLMSTFDAVDAMIVLKDSIYATTYYANQLYVISLNGMKGEDFIEVGGASAPLLLDDDSIYCNYYKSSSFLSKSCAFGAVDLQGNLPLYLP